MWGKARAALLGRQNIDDADVRRRYGRLAGLVGIGVNLLLFAGKLGAGLAFHSVSVSADAVNNLSDAGTSLLALVSLRMASKPADAEHPFGHARMEYIASLVMAFLILLLGVELIKTSVHKIITPDAITFSAVTVWVLALSILAKAGLYALNKRLGRRMESALLKATAADSMADMLSTTAVLFSTILSPLLRKPLDGYMGVLVALFILYTGFRILMESQDYLLGQAPGAELTRLISRYVLGYDGIIGIHDLMVHTYGPGRCFASVHAEVPATRDIIDSHDIIDDIERDIAAEHGIHLVIHLDPVDTQDEETARLRSDVQQMVRQIEPSLSMHDFRIRRGKTHSKLIFDVAVPYACAMTDEQIRAAIEKGIKAKDGSYYAVVTLDRTYASLSQPNADRG
ncbi:MAG: cation diffusion facilitator family transporter [Eubacteriales bacterium]|nr:cation diffusion facilitator family transporter [Eubacteriales bacterium]